MLVLARKVGQSIVIGDNVELMVIEVRGDQVRLGVTAPKDIPVHRKELLEQIRQENLMAGDSEKERDEKSERREALVAAAKTVAKRQNAV